MKCYFCGKKEDCFKKVWYEDGQANLSPVEFWLCQNPDCKLYQEILLDKIIIKPGSEPFSWQRAVIPVSKALANYIQIINNVNSSLFSQLP